VAHEALRGLFEGLGDGIAMQTRVPTIGSEGQPQDIFFEWEQGVSLSVHAAIIGR
jgi:hypothetical protein